MSTKPTIADVTRASRARAERTSESEAHRVIEKIAGANVTLENVDPELYPRIIEELERDSAPTGELDPAAIYAHWNSCRRAPRDGDVS